MQNPIITDIVTRLTLAVITFVVGWVMVNGALALQHLKENLKDQRLKDGLEHIATYAELLVKYAAQVLPDPGHGSQRYQMAATSLAAQFPWLTPEQIRVPIEAAVYALKAAAAQSTPLEPMLMSAPSAPAQVVVNTTITPDAPPPAPVAPVHPVIDVPTTGDARG